MAATPTAAFFGRTTLDLLYLLDALPAEDTKVYARAFRAAPGGPACNASITHALLGGDATLFTALGQGLWADAVRTELARFEINLVDIAAGTDYETPLTTVLTGSARGTRTIINPPAYQATFPPLPVEWQPAWGPKPDIVLTDGFHLQESLPLLRALHHQKIPIVLDGGSWKPGTDDIAPLVTAAICSERFAPPGHAPDPETTLNWFASRSVRSAAVTRGPRSILALHNGIRLEIAIPTIDARDTAGAGDVLHGAFCYFYAESADFEASLRAASEIATRSCQSVGIDCWLPTQTHP
jgi:sugar/nucleoside kinase (ribokinase family)